jgi:hypothetical protein
MSLVLQRLVSTQRTLCPCIVVACIVEARVYVPVTGEAGVSLKRVALWCVAWSIIIIIIIIYVCIVSATHTHDDVSLMDDVTLISDPT